MLLDKEKEVQGQALYLEFRKAYSTIQVLITPEGYNEAGQITPAMFYRRMLTNVKPKKRWNVFNLRDNLTRLAEDGAYVDANEVPEAISKRANYLYGYMEGLVRGGYASVSDDPIYVEVTKEDLTLIGNRDTPIKVINRVKACRSALNYPEAVVTVPTSLAV